LGLALAAGLAVPLAAAQLARIHAKAGGSSHCALVALFLDDLIDPALPAAGEAAWSDRS
jgi:hypothetical protein